MLRRPFLAGAVASFAAPAIARAEGTRVLRMVPQANLSSLDPIWTTVGVTRAHGYMVYDTLYGRDIDLRAQPQMAAGHVVENDGRKITITLRDGLAFHDGERVRARDAVVSIRRWMKRNAYGQMLEPITDELAAPDDRTIQFRLSRPFPILFDALSAVGAAPCFVMPERIALTDAFKQINDPTGSGPFRFKRDEFNSGSRVVYERNPAYVPREGGVPSLTAGPKRVFFDRVEWEIITDTATATAAVLKGEIDWFEQPSLEQQEVLSRDRNVVVDLFDPRPTNAFLRLNHLYPPFNDVRVRRALLPAIVQADFMTAVMGTDPSGFLANAGVFTPGTPYATDAGMDVLTGPRDRARAQGLLRETGYRSEKMKLIGPTDNLAPAALTQIGADLFQRLDFDVDLALSDWGTVIQRRASREPVDKGGWSALLTTFISFDFVDPVSHSLARGNGVQGWPGWPTSPRVEALRDSWLETPTVEARQAICADIQRTVLDEVLYIPVGAFYPRTALRRDIVDRLPGVAIFWNLRRA
jgi:peptide/nickel transport system substrate-binding protein